MVRNLTPKQRLNKEIDILFDVSPISTVMSQFAVGTCSAVTSSLQLSHEATCGCVRQDIEPNHFRHHVVSLLLSHRDYIESGVFDETARSQKINSTASQVSVSLRNLNSEAERAQPEAGCWVLETQVSTAAGTG